MADGAITTTTVYDSEDSAVVVAISAQNGWNAERTLRAIAKGKPKPADAIRARAEVAKGSKRVTLFELAHAYEGKKVRHPRFFCPEWMDHGDGTLRCMGRILGNSNGGSAIHAMLVLGGIEHSISILNVKGSDCTVEYGVWTITVRVGTDLPERHIRQIADRIAILALQLGQKLRISSKAPTEVPVEISVEVPVETPAPPPTTAPVSDFREKRQVRTRARLFAQVGLGG
jgi:hypothetical protein